MVKYCSFSHPPLLNNRALIDIIYIGVNNRLIMAGQKIEDRIMDTFTLFLRLDARELMESQ